MRGLGSASGPLDTKIHVGDDAGGQGHVKLYTCGAGMTAVQVGVLYRQLKNTVLEVG